MSGRVVHFEIPFDDGERAQDFYRQAFGWQLQSIPGMGYTMVSSGPSGDTGPTEPGFINGGMMSREDSPSASPILVVDVASIDDALNLIGELGGKTLRGKEPVGNMGFAAYVNDPEGNVVGLWETSGRS
jgi:predicted enzyme related to lactoylglutathione lyase